MKIEISLNKLENTWWFDLGIGVQKTEYHNDKNYVILIALAFFSVYIRW